MKECVLGYFKECLNPNVYFFYTFGFRNGVHLELDKLVFLEFVD